MSKDYFIVCKDCIESFGAPDFVTSPDPCQAWLDDAENLAQVAEAVLKCKKADLQIAIGLDGWFLDPTGLLFFLRHRGHNLVVMDEYQWFDIQYPSDADGNMSSDDDLTLSEYWPTDDRPLSLKLRIRKYCNWLLYICPCCEKPGTILGRDVGDHSGCVPF